MYAIRSLEELLESREQLRVSEHALREAHKEGLRAQEVIHAIFHGRMVERYPERQRMLVVGPPWPPVECDEFQVPIHVVCDYSDGDEIVAVTVYIPNRPRWLNDLVRGCAC